MVLHRLRVKAGLTGAELGRLVKMSQSKISRIETGMTQVAPRDVGRVARALGATSDLVARLVERAELAQNRVTDLRTAAGSVSTLQRAVARGERGAREFRIFRSDVVAGLAQTGEYARAVLASVREIRDAVDPEAEHDVFADVLAARIQRQGILADPDRRFFLLMAESALTQAVGGAETMLGQIRRLRVLAEQPNVSLRIIPSDAPWTLPFVHGFELMDSQSVVIDVFSTSMIATGAQDVAVYRYVFDRLDQGATSEIEPILDRYRRYYLDRLT
ncbi:helix-turn-helix domain-containing protein [Actinoplanes solisilvae]|uniref:helix-turn-helix domain-containing protein n=1 Tax=Actinoplanes solisilvae TaxID=2486853 RepID=UPI0021036BFA|nr:helix-turn-helix transcriptional regulator [Actinoplanes solisilvae]